MLRFARVVPLLVAFGSGGCIEQMLIDGQVEGTRKASARFDSTADFEIAEAASAAGLAQFEGLYELAPSHHDAVYMLIKAYASHGYAFVEDELERAILKGDDEHADYQKQRAVSLYTRAIEYGVVWLAQRHPGAKAVLDSGNEKQWVDYVAKFDDKKDGEILYWIANAWIARVNVAKESALIGTLYVGKVLLDRAIALDAALEFGQAEALAGAYDARTGEVTLGPASFATSKAHFDNAKKLASGYLLSPVLQALTYACHMSDDSVGRTKSFALYRATLQSVIDAPDPMPSQRLSNAIAKRRARRYLSRKWIEEVMREDCGWDLSVVPPASLAPVSAATSTPESK
jgi:TRAP transporter T-component